MKLLKKLFRVTDSDGLDHMDRRIAERTRERLEVEVVARLRLAEELSRAGMEEAAREARAKAQEARNREEEISRGMGL